MTNLRMNQFYKTKICPWYYKGRCERGTACRFAHSETEKRALPDLSRTSLCTTFLKHGTCNTVNCRFAHNVDQLRATDDMYKTSLCFMFMKSRCEAADQCRHAHGTHELRAVPGATGTSNLRPPPPPPAPAQRAPGDASFVLSPESAISAPSYAAGNQKKSRLSPEKLFMDEIPNGSIVAKRQREIQQKTRIERPSWTSEALSPKSYYASTKGGEATSSLDSHKALSQFSSATEDSTRTSSTATEPLALWALKGSVPKRSPDTRQHEWPTSFMSYTHGDSLERMQSGDSSTVFKSLGTGSMEHLLASDQAMHSLETWISKERPSLSQANASELYETLHSDSCVLEHSKSTEAPSRCLGTEQTLLESTVPILQQEPISGRRPCPMTFTNEKESLRTRLLESRSAQNMSSIGVQKDSYPVSGDPSVGRSSLATPVASLMVPRCRSSLGFVPKNEGILTSFTDYATVLSEIDIDDLSHGRGGVELFGDSSKTRNTDHQRSVSVPVSPLGGLGLATYNSDDLRLSSFIPPEPEEQQRVGNALPSPIHSVLHRSPLVSTVETTTRPNGLLVTPSFPDNDFQGSWTWNTEVAHVPLFLSKRTLPLGGSEEPAVPAMSGTISENQSTLGTYAKVPTNLSTSENLISQDGVQSANMRCSLYSPTWEVGHNTRKAGNLREKWDANTRPFSVHPQTASSSPSKETSLRCSPLNLDALSFPIVPCQGEKEWGTCPGDIKSPCDDQLVSAGPPRIVITAPPPGTPLSPERRQLIVSASMESALRLPSFSQNPNNQGIQFPSPDATLFTDTRLRSESYTDFVTCITSDDCLGGVPPGSSSSRLLGCRENGHKSLNIFFSPTSRSACGLTDGIMDYGDAFCSSKGASPFHLVLAGHRGRGCLSIDGGDDTKSLHSGQTSPSCTLLQPLPLSRQGSPSPFGERARHCFPVGRPSEPHQEQQGLWSLPGVRVDTDQQKLSSTTAGSQELTAHNLGSMPFFDDACPLSPRNLIDKKSGLSMDIYKTLASLNIEPKVSRGKSNTVTTGFCDAHSPGLYSGSDDHTMQAGALDIEDSKSQALAALWHLRTDWKQNCNEENKEAIERGNPLQPCVLRNTWKSNKRTSLDSSAVTASTTTTTTATATPTRRSSFLLTPRHQISFETDKSGDGLPLLLPQSALENLQPIELGAQKGQTSPGGWQTAGVLSPKECLPCLDVQSKRSDVLSLNTWRKDSVEENPFKFASSMQLPNQEKNILSWPTGALPEWWHQDLATIAEPERRSLCLRSGPSPTKSTLMRNVGTPTEEMGMAFPRLLKTSSEAFDPDMPLKRSSCGSALPKPGYGHSPQSAPSDLAPVEPSSSPKLKTAPSEPLCQHLTLFSNMWSPEASSSSSFSSKEKIGQPVKLKAATVGQRFRRFQRKHAMRLNSFRRDTLAEFPEGASLLPLRVDHDAVLQDLHMRGPLSLHTSISPLANDTGLPYGNDVRQ